MIWHYMLQDVMLYYILYCIHAMTHHISNFSYDIIYHTLYLKDDIFLVFMPWSCVDIPCYLFMAYHIHLFASLDYNVHVISCFIPLLLSMPCLLYFSFYIIYQIFLCTSIFFTILYYHVYMFYISFYSMFMHITTVIMYLCRYIMFLFICSDWFSIIHILNKHCTK